MKKTHRNVVLITLLLVFQMIHPAQLVSAKQTFPSNPADITYIAYDYVQTFRHFSSNPLTGGGSIKINMSLTSEDNYSISSNYDLIIYPFICNEPVPFKGKINYTMDPESRYIKTGLWSIGAMNPETLFSNLFISDTYFGEEFSTRFWIEDLMMIRGYIMDLNFEYNGSSDVIIKNSMVNCHKITLDVSLLFPISICGLGTGIVMNVTTEYHYEKLSGLLVYTNGRYYEYVYDDPIKYQTHTITKTLVDMNYRGQPKESFNPFIDYEFLGDPNLVFGVSGIIGIVLITMLILKKLNKYKQKLEAEEYVKLKQSEALKKLRKEDNNNQEPELPKD